MSIQTNTPAFDAELKPKHARSMGRRGRFTRIRRLAMWHTRCVRMAEDRGFVFGPSAVRDVVTGEQWLAMMRNPGTDPVSATV